MTPAAYNFFLRSYSTRFNSSVAWRERKVASWLLTVASCRRGSISRTGVPASTRWPECTKIFVTSPSTCGCSAETLRDFSVARYSVVSGTSCACSVCTFTGNAGGPPAALAFESCLLQPTTAKRAPRQINFKTLLGNAITFFFNGIGLPAKATRSKKFPSLNATRATGAKITRKRGEFQERGGEELPM